MIEIKNLTKVYGSGSKAVHALDQIDLTIGSGMFGLLGPNGAGKTTLMRIIAGIVHPSGGQVIVNSHDLSQEQGRTAVKTVLGYLPQELGMYPELSARQFVDYMAILKGVDDASLRKHRVDDVLHMVGLGDQAAIHVPERREANNHVLWMAYQEFISDTDARYWTGGSWKSGLPLTSCDSGVLPLGLRASRSWGEWAARMAEW